MTEISYCGVDQKRVEDFLKEDLKLSGQSLKKFNLSKKFLNKTLRSKETLSLPLDLLNRELVNPQYSGPEVSILFEDEELLVIDKPAAVHGHPLTYSDSSNLLSFLRKNGHFEVANLGIGGQEKGWLYRLDFETSGVLVGCKKAEDYLYFRENFSKAVRLKRYLCLVKGVGPADGEYAFYLKSFGPSGAQVSASLTGEGAPALCSMKKLGQHDDVSLYQVDLQTGARHQIRATFQALGYPLIGDTLYEGIPADRLYLHAYEYQVVKRDGEVMVFKSLPSCFGNDFLDLNSLLKMLHDEPLISKS